MAKRPEIEYIHFYTGGSAAPQVAPLIQDDPYYAPRIRKRKKKLIYVDPVSILALAISTVLAVCMYTGIRENSRIEAEILQMEQYVYALEEKQANLKKEYADGYDLEAVKKTAEAMGMVPADQVPQVVLQVEGPVQETEAAEPTVWEKIHIFFTGLFA